jgi:phospholipid-transporting ATPase
VAGEALTKIQKKPVLKAPFVALALRAEVCLMCRVSPKQKAEIVQMVREQRPSAVTLAIGDGANDVNMITEAHVGVGISGLEGQQAARSADYAIGQFRFLKDLLFFHGREAYRKNSFLVIYMFYKNILFVTPLFVFGFLNGFSGQTFYDKWLY